MKRLRPGCMTESNSFAKPKAVSHTTKSARRMTESTTVDTPAVATVNTLDALASCFAAVLLKFAPTLTHCSFSIGSQSIMSIEI